MSTSSVIITELTGRKRRLELRGGGLPSHGTAFPSKMRVITTWMPGSSEATQQVLGPEEGDPSWQGYWSTPMLASFPCLYREGSGADQRVARAQTLVTIVDSIRQSGARLRIQWIQDDDYGEQREGRIEEFEPAYRTKDDVNWTIKWAWSGRGGSKSRVVQLKKDGQLAQHKKIESELAKLTAELTAQRIVSSNKDILGSASHFSLGDVESFIEGIKNFTGGFARQIQALGDRIRQIGDLAQSVEELPADVAQQFIDAAATVVSDCSAFSRAVSRRGPETYARFDQSAGIRTLMQASGYLNSSKAAADATVLAAAEARAALIKRAGIRPGSQGAQGKPQSSVLTFVIARAGDTFASIAKKQLGDPTLGPAVAKASGYALFDQAPRVGDVILVPTAQAAQQLMPGG